MDGSQVRIRGADAGDADAVAALAQELAQSFTFSRGAFDLSFPALLAAEDTCLLVAAVGKEWVGYLLGFAHPTFYANGPVGWVEEVLVRQEHRGRGVGRALMSEFELWATTNRRPTSARCCDICGRFSISPIYKLIRLSYVSPVEGKRRGIGEGHTVDEMGPWCRGPG